MKLYCARPGIKKSVFLQNVMDEVHIVAKLHQSFIVGETTANYFTHQEREEENELVFEVPRKLITEEKRKEHAESQ